MKIPQPEDTYSHQDIISPHLAAVYMIPDTYSVGQFERVFNAKKIQHRLGLLLVGTDVSNLSDGL